jgi:hypothetical protein
MGQILSCPPANVCKVYTLDTTCLWSLWLWEYNSGVVIDVRDTGNLASVLAPCKGRYCATSGGGMRFILSRLDRSEDIWF